MSDLDTPRAASRRKMMAGGAVFGLLVAAGLTYDALRPPEAPAPPPVPLHERNEYVEVQPDGQRMRVYRWPWKEGEPPYKILHLRIPNTYIWGGGGFAAGLKAALGPKYKDPNETQPHIQHFFIEALWPSLEPTTGLDDPRHKETLSTGVMRIQISNNNGWARKLDEEAVAPPIIEGHFRSRMKNLSHPWFTQKYKLYYGTKSERFGLERYGPIAGDFEQLRGDGSIYELYFPKESPKDRFIQCTTDQIIDSLEDPNGRAYTSCEHHFYSLILRATVMVDYRRIYLPHWREIEAKIEALLKTFEMRPIVVEGTAP